MRILSIRPILPILTTLERLRLRLHFARVLSEMRRAAPPEHADAGRRAATLRELGRYARAGAFPRHGGRGAPRPVFIDAGGNRCAMAHLLECDGHPAAVHTIAATRNHAYVDELARDADVAAAIRGLGIRQAEAARIQPCYYPSALECLFAFVIQWTGVLSVLWMARAAVRGIRARKSAAAGAHPGWGRRIAATGLALLLVLASVASYASTTDAPRSGYCGGGEDYAVCGSGFSVPAIIRQLRGLGEE